MALLKERSESETGTRTQPVFPSSVRTLLAVLDSADSAIREEEP